MRVLLAIDGSKFSQAAIGAVIGQFRQKGTEVTVLHLVEPTEYLGFATAATEEEISRAQELVNRASQTLRTAGFNVESVVNRGEARTGIIDYAEKWRADVIVLGSHGQTELVRFLFGSVSDAVIRHAPCSVEIVRFSPGCDVEK